MTVPANLAVKYKGITADLKVPVDFTFKTYSAGILIGKQFNWRRLGIDLVVIGPHFGKAKTFMPLQVMLPWLNSMMKKNNIFWTK